MQRGESSFGTPVQYKESVKRESARAVDSTEDTLVRAARRLLSGENSERRLKPRGTWKPSRYSRDDADFTPSPLDFQSIG